MRDKKSLRKELLARRKEFAAEHPEAGGELASRVLEWLEGHPEISSVGAYLPIRSEPDLTASLTAWRNGKSGRTLSLPVILEGQMDYYEWIPGMQMDEAGFHLLVPHEKKLVHPDFVLAPCVGFSEEGSRIGFGAGWFDRTLPRLKPAPVTMAIAYEISNATGEFEPEPHDVLLQWIATERGIRLSRKRAA